VNELKQGEHFAEKNGAYKHFGPSLPPSLPPTHRKPTVPSGVSKANTFSYGPSSFPSSSSPPPSRPRGDEGDNEDNDGADPEETGGEGGGEGGGDDSFVAGCIK